MPSILPLLRRGRFSLCTPPFLMLTSGEVGQEGVGVSDA